MSTFSRLYGTWYYGQLIKTKDLFVRILVCREAIGKLTGPNTFCQPKDLIRMVSYLAMYLLKMQLLQPIRKIFSRNAEFVRGMSFIMKYLSSPSLFWFIWDRCKCLMLSDLRSSEGLHTYDSKALSPRHLMLCKTVITATWVFTKHASGLERV